MNAPADFPLEEYEALRRGFGYLELAGWTSITITGNDRQAFLNNFCTNDVKRLQPGEHCEAFILNVKGKILGHGRVHSRAEELIFITVPGQAEKLIAHLDRYVIREDVQLRDTTDERKYTLIAGGDGDGAGARLTHDHWIHWRLFEVEVCGVLESPAKALAVLQEELQADGAKVCGPMVFEALRIESGTPLFGVDFDEENLPQEVGRDEEAISFTKGCYLGQETVARIDALGHVNQTLVGVRFAGDTIPKAGTELMKGGAVAGRVTSATYSPLLCAPLALAMVRRNFAPPGMKMGSAAGDCAVVELPIHAPRS